MKTIILILSVITITFSSDFSYMVTCKVGEILKEDEVLENFQKYVLDKKLYFCQVDAGALMCYRTSDTTTVLACSEFHLDLEYNTPKE